MVPVITNNSFLCDINSENISKSFKSACIISELALRKRDTECFNTCEQ